MAAVVLPALAAVAPAPYPAIAHAQSPAPAPVVRLPFPQDDGSLTPYTFELGHPLMTLVYDTLLWRDERGVPQPWLAASVDTAPDGRRITLRLDDTARWHDGMPVTAADVAFTFDFMTTHPHPRFSGELRAIARVRATDAATVSIDLRHPSPGFLDQPLSDVPILPRHLWEGLGVGEVPTGLPVGSGPYRLVDHQSGVSYRFQRNAEYFRGPPAVEVIDVPIMPDAEATFRALERRQVDMIPLNLSDDLAASLESFGVRMARGPSYQGTVLLFNLRTPPFDRAEVRRAVGQALDLERITRNVATAVPADRGYLHPQSRFAAREPLHRADVEAARPVLGSLADPVVVLAPETDEVRAEAGRQVVLALQRAGATAELRAVPRSELSRAVGEDGSTPTFGAAIWGAPPLASHDPDFLRRLFGSSVAEAPFNYGGYRSADFDALADRIGTAVPTEARQAAVEEGLRLLTTDAPVIPLFFAEAAYAYRPAVYDGWVFVQGTGILDKRSFVDVPPKPAAGPTIPSPATDDDVPLAAVALGLGALAAVLAVGGLVVSLRRRP